MTAPSQPAPVPPEPGNSNLISALPVKDLYSLPHGSTALLDFGTFTITVKRRDDWQAWLNGNEGVWGCGPSLDFAVGYVILTMIGWQHTLASNEHPELHKMAREILVAPAVPGPPPRDVVAEVLAAIEVEIERRMKENERYQNSLALGPSMDLGRIQGMRRALKIVRDVAGVP